MPFNQTYLISFGEIMSEKKSVPAYQRDFVWEGDLTYSFLENIWEAFQEGREDYFCGSMVMFKNKSGVYEIVDGQQRTTVLYILVCQLLQRISDITRNTDYVGQQRTKYIYASSGASTSTRDFYFTHKNPKIGNCYKSIGTGKGMPNPINDEEDILMKNLRNCDQQASDFIGENLPESDAKKAEEFYKFIRDDVKFTHFIAKNISEALLIYSRLNSGGKALGYLEIIKGKLFESISNNPDRESEIEQLWNEFWLKFKTPVRIGGQGTPKNLINEDTFLAYYFLINYPYLVEEIYASSEGFLPTNKITEFLLKRRAIEEIFSDPKGLIESLNKFVGLMANMRIGENDDAEVSKYLKDIALLSQSQTQPLMFLLRAHYRDEALFKSVLPITMGLVFVFSLSVTGTGSTSKVWRSLTREIEEHKGKSVQKLTDIILSSAKGYLRTYWDSNFIPFVANLHLKKNKRKAKVVLLMNEIAARGVKKHTQKAHYSDFYKTPGYDVDHLAPESSSDEAYVQKLGNAAILGSTANRSLKKKPFSSNAKRDALSRSNIFSTRALVQDDDPEGGATAKIMGLFTAFGNIDEKAVQVREKEILRCIRTYFGID